jgi:ferritin-like metal-binding protein YciE
MATVINLNDLLRHEILDLYSAEEQILEALPKMFEKANDVNLKNALSDHFKVTEQQKKRLDHVKHLLGENGDGENPGENKGFFSRLYDGTNGQKCIGTEGLIHEGEKMMREDMSPEALDAAIIASAQKIEHYEISGYGTARAFARELNLVDVAGLLTQTLNEEYEADDRLTQLAVGKLNIEAEYATVANENSGRSGNRRSASTRVGANSKPSNSKSKKSNSSKNARSGKNISGGNGLFKSSPGSSNKSTSKSSPGSSNKSISKSTSRLTPGKSASKSAPGSSKKSASKSFTRPSPPKSASKSSSSTSPIKSTSKSSKVAKVGSFKKSAVSGRSSAVKSAAKSSVKNKSAKKAVSANWKNSTNKKSKSSGRR